VQVFGEKARLRRYVERYGDGARAIATLLDLLRIARVGDPAGPSFGLKVIEQHAGFKHKLPEGNSQWGMAKFIKAGDPR
jgi:hypothetical protein